MTPRRCLHRLSMVGDDDCMCACPGFSGASNMVPVAFCDTRCPKTWATKTAAEFCAVQKVGCPEPSWWQRKVASVMGWLRRQRMYPPIAEQAVNLILAAKSIVVSGAKRASEATRQRRMDICKSCPSGLYVPVDQRCRACGCNVAASKILDKLQWAAMECPKGHWGREL